MLMISEFSLVNFDNLVINVRIRNCCGWNVVTFDHFGENSFLLETESRDGLIKFHNRVPLSGKL